MSAPRLFVVAGPNGSGKSLFSKELTESDFEVFDGDKHLTALRKQYPETGSDALQSHVNDTLFAAEKAKAMALRLNYAYETNFSFSTCMNTPHDFLKAGYEIHLIFIGLETLEDSIQRVEYRVKLGGHKVPEDSIRFNFENGFKNLYKYYSDFNSVTCFDNSIGEGPEFSTPVELLHIVEGKLFVTSKECPAWAKPFLKDI
ncbi:zeta toxin family protein [Pedobacter ginsengisoli]|uniref:zeta toxin family protein n=1 Tax=Pedobacter ginsengisoli TaxID=363852 RepID=UPI00254DC171|nr:zeta toxin family protein [Pedobacter ginsengisoli]